MISNRPYLIRAFHQWIVDSNCTPILVLDANNPRCKIPKDFAEDGEIVFNISSSAVRDLKLSNDVVEFKASFSGLIHIISAPTSAVLAIYAEENGEGLFLDAEVDEAIDEELMQLNKRGDLVSDTLQKEVTSAPGEVTAGKNKPFLTLIE